MIEIVFHIPFVLNLRFKIYAIFMYLFLLHLLEYYQIKLYRLFQLNYWYAL